MVIIWMVSKMAIVLFGNSWLNKYDYLWSNRGVKTMEEAYYRTSDTDADASESRNMPWVCIEKTKSKRNNPLLAALLSCIIPGLGQVYALIYFEDLHNLLDWGLVSV